MCFMQILNLSFSWKNKNDNKNVSLANSRVTIGLDNQIVSPFSFHVDSSHFQYWI